MSYEVTGIRRRETGDGRRETGDRRQETGDRKQETGDRRQETGDRKQETGDRKQETGDRRQETGDRKQETGNGRQETGDRRQHTFISNFHSFNHQTHSIQMAVQSAKELTVYKKAYSLSMEIFEISKRFPTEERWALTGQIRRSSRSICNNLREAWAKRRYEAHFISKLTDCDGEANETDTSLDFARDCGYITLEEYHRLVEINAEVCKMLGSMIRDPKPFLL
jgi:four helix bundle protein